MINICKAVNGYMLHKMHLMQNMINSVGYQYRKAPNHYFDRGFYYMTFRLFMGRCPAQRNWYLLC